MKASLSFYTTFGWIALSQATNDFGRNPTVITRDVAILGGGASGSHAAVNLRDEGKSVVVIEAQDHLGGHSHAYHDPANGQSADYGVQILLSSPVISDFYGRYKIPLKPAFGVPGVTINADFLTGRKVDLPVFSQNQTVAAYAAWLALVQKYPYLVNGAYLPERVPDELLLPLSTIIAKYKLQPIAPTLNTFFQGWPDFDNLLLFYALRYFSEPVTVGLLSGAFVRSATNDNGRIYLSVQAELGPDVLLSSTVTRTERCASSGYQQLWVKTPKGTVLIKAKKILVTVPPVLENMNPFDLDSREATLFRKLRPMNHWTGLLRNSAIPVDTTIANTGEHTKYNQIQLPGTSGYTPTADPLLHGWVYTSYEPTTESETKLRVQGEMRRLKEHQVVNRTSAPEFAAIKHHDNYAVTVSAEDVKRGFYKNLYGLQGYKGTYYAGAFFSAQSTWNVFNYTVVHVLPSILKDLK